MDVPDLNQDLIDKIVPYSDKQSSNHSIRDLERIRDENLVAIMQSLKLNNWGAGSVLKDYEEKLYTKAHSGVFKSEPDFSKPLRLYESVVPPDWLDYNGHMNESRYLQVFSDASDAMLNLIGMDEEYRSQDFSFYTVETHIRHLNEVGASEPIFIETQLLGFDEKRIRINHILIHPPSGNTLATGEQMLLHVNTEKGRAVQMGKAIYEILEKIWEGHQNLADPEYAGKGILKLKNL
jgi:Predicted thioesterase